jgi:hypothetical protein
MHETSFIIPIYKENIPDGHSGNIGLNISVTEFVSPL